MRGRLQWMVVVLVEKEKGDDMCHHHLNNMPHRHHSWLLCIENLHIIVGNMAPASHEKKGEVEGVSCYSPPCCLSFIVVM